MAIVYKIAGVDVTDRIEKGSVTIKSVMTKQTDTFDFVLVDHDNTTKPLSGQEVEVIEDAVKIFGGLISEVDREIIGPTPVNIYEIRSTDFSKVLEKRLVLASFNSLPAGQIVKNIVTNFVQDPSVTVANVIDGPTVEFAGFNFRPALEAITELARLVAFDWFIDENKDIHFFPSTTNIAPLIVASNTFFWRGLKLRPDATQLRNRVIVRGGKQFSSPFVQLYAGDAKKREFPLVGFSRSVSVREDTGGGPVAKTIGVDNIDDPSAFDYLFNFNEKLVKSGSGSPTLISTDELEVTYEFEIPILIQQEDGASQTDTAILEGNDGIYEHIIVDESIETIQAARDRALAELRRFAKPLLRGSFETFERGFRAGQLLTIDLPNADIIEQDFLIHEVTTKSEGPGLLLSTVAFGSFSFALEDFLLDLFKRGRKVVVRQGEVLDDLVTGQETIQLTDSAPVFFEKVGPWSWGPGGFQDTVWGEGAWF